MNVDEMPAGREMDALVAEKVMGWYKVGAMWCKDANSFAAQAEYLDGCPKVWAPSTDIAAAWEVVEYVGKRPMWSYSVEESDKGCMVFFTDREAEIGWSEEAETAPLAICRAALKAISRSED